VQSTQQTEVQSEQLSDRMPVSRRRMISIGLTDKTGSSRAEKAVSVDFVKLHCEDNGSRCSLLVPLKFSRLLKEIFTYTGIIES